MRFTQQLGVIEKVERIKIEDNVGSEKNKTRSALSCCIQRPGQGSSPKSTLALAIKDF